MLGFSPWVAVLVVLLAALVGRLLPPRAASAIERLLNSRGIVVAIGVLTGAIALWLWGSLTRTPVLHDESAYLLQAELFARFRWTASPPPLPEFFEQLHILVDGVLASKYPPGNSLILALGILVGLPGLPIIVMNACAASLMFVLARRAAGGVVALLTIVVWETSFPMIYYHASYMSEGVSSLAWLVTWWAIVRWRAQDGRKWLVIAAAAVAWCMITRPVTGLALGLVACAVVLWHCRATHCWRDLVPALGIGAVILAIVPLWNWRTTGNALEMPLSYYTRTYVPFDKPGFGSRPADGPKPRLPRDQERIQEAFFRDHVQHTVRALPAIAWKRLTMIDRDMWYEWRGGLRLFALVGLVVMGAEGWVVLAAFAMQFLLYLTYAHPAFWTLYYVEVMPVLAFVIALGIGRVFRLLGKREQSVVTAPLGATMIVATAGLFAMMVVARQVKDTLREDHSYYDAFTRLIERIPDERAIVFVRYGDKHLDGLSLVRNVPDLATAPVWTVYDRGADNARLIALAPERTPYLFDETSWTLRRLQVASASGSKR